jgi:DNA polymerase III epsilon subunit-like protein
MGRTYVVKSVASSSMNEFDQRDEMHRIKPIMFSNQTISRKKLVIFLVVLCCCGNAALALSQASKHLLITEVSPHNPEFIEIYNPMDQDVSLDGYWFCYYPPTEEVSWDTPWRSRPFPAGALIRSHSYFLVTLGHDAIVNDPLGDWNVYSNKMLNGEGGTVAILNDAPGKGKVVDAIGWGSSHLFLGGVVVRAPEGWALSRMTGTSREEPFHDSGDNAADFYHTLPAPSSARLGVVLISNGSQIINPMTSTSEFSLCNAGLVARSFAIVTESEIGYTAIPLQPTVSLEPGEWATIELLHQPYDYYVVDLETSGLNPMSCSIIEAAWVHVSDGEVVQSDSSLIFLGEALNPTIISLTGITNEMLEAAPNREIVIPPMLNEIAGNPVLSYNTNAFDRRFLEATAAVLGEDMPVIQWIDVLSLTRRALPDLLSHSLQTVTKLLGIDDCHHRALSDSLMTNQVFQEAVRRLECPLHVTMCVEGSALPIGALVLPLELF